MKHDNAGVFSHMDKAELYRWVVWSVPFIWLALLMWLSAENGTATNRTSSRLTAAIVGLLGISEKHAAGLNHLLRTFAHVFVFFVFSSAVYYTAWVSQPYQSGTALRSFIACIILAVIDEVKKLWIPGRHLDWGEMGLNCIGAAVGVCLALYYIRRWTWQYKAKVCLARYHPGIAVRIK